MEKHEKKDCCSGCQKGNSGSNASCQAKLIVEAMKKTEVVQVSEIKNKRL